MAGGNRTNRSRRSNAGDGWRQNTPSRSWLAAHRLCLTDSLSRLAAHWPATILTALVMGITLALPTGLYIASTNLNALTTHWQRSVTISLYLKHATDGRRLARRLDSDSDIAATHYISAAEGLKQFRKTSQLGDALDALADNPLPAVIRVTPRANLSTHATQALAKRLGGNAAVAQARLDGAWLTRLNAIIALIGRGVWVIGGLLALAVLFIVGNTIRLDIENRRAEIEVMKLLGATDAYIRRPFLYTGVWYGLLGAATALVLLLGCYLALRAPLATLIHSYGGAATTSGINARLVVCITCVGVGLGWLGSALAANHRLASIEPE